MIGKTYPKDESTPQPSAATAAQPRMCASDYQHLSLTVAAMTRQYEDGVEINWHSHKRGQLLCCESGFMTAQTGEGTYILPRGHGLIIAPDVPHRVRAHGRVDMRTLYIKPDAPMQTAWEPARVVRISRLMGALIEALIGTSPEHAETTRQNHLTALALEELSRSEECPFALPMPTDKRLQKMCVSLTQSPGLPGDIDDWAQQLGMSRRTLTRRFREDLNMSFVEWRRRVRLAYVLKAQAEGQRLDQIAVDVGYRSSSALRLAFRNSLHTVVS